MSSGGDLSNASRFVVNPIEEIQTDVSGELANAFR